MVRTTCTVSPPALNPHPRDMLLIRSVDALRDLLTVHYPRGGTCRLGDLPGWDHAFPRARGIQERLSVPGDLGRLQKHMARRMRAAWHPEARSYVYAYAYRCAPLRREEEVVACSALTAASVGRRDGWVDGYKLVKVGASANPQARQLSHLTELRRRLPGLAKAGLYYSLDCRLLLLPCEHPAAGDYLESVVLECLPGVDCFRGEWFHDTLGVVKTLAVIFALAHACSLPLK